MNRNDERDNAVMKWSGIVLAGTTFGKWCKVYSLEGLAEKNAIALEIRDQPIALIPVIGVDGKKRYDQCYAIPVNAWLSADAPDWAKGIARELGLGIEDGTL